jgi:O-antigen ligase
MKFFRVAICSLLAFAVLAFGATEEWSQAVLEVAASVLLIAWAIQMFIRKADQLIIAPEFLPLLAFGVVALVQFFFHLTASRYFTRVELQLLATYLIVLFLMAQAFSQRHHWRAFLWFLMTFGFIVSLFAILQNLTFNGKLYWFRVLHYPGYPFGPYANRNHFAGFAEIIIPFALVPLVLGKVRRERIFLVAIFAIAPIVALLLSASRGGIISFAVEVLILFVLLLVRRIQSTRVIFGAVIVLVGVLIVTWIGANQVLARFSGIQSIEVSAGKRTAMQRDTLRIFLDHPVIGTGLGTLQMVYPPYDSLYDGRIVNHAHNDYLEALAETGILGGLCCLWFLSVLFLHALKGLFNLGTSFGATLNFSGLIACCGLLVHSLVDFNLHIPANALLFLVSAHIAAVRLPSSVPTGMNHHSPGIQDGNH